jgi:hypothetical protein
MALSPTIVFFSPCFRLNYVGTLGEKQAFIIRIIYLWFIKIYYIRNFHLIYVTLMENLSPSPAGSSRRPLCCKRIKTIHCSKYISRCSIWSYHNGKAEDSQILTLWVQTSSTLEHQTLHSCRIRIRVSNTESGNLTR